MREHAVTAEQQQAVLDSLIFKCDVLWSQLDALYLAYVDPRLPLWRLCSEPPPMTDETVTPRLRRGVKFRFDETRQAWILLAPEKLFTPQGTAVEILKRVDGAQTLGEIVDDHGHCVPGPARPDRPRRRDHASRP